jgi:NMD protein affecting ribosome stability and mRNA decay
MSSYRSTVSVTATTVMPGDVIQIGGRPLRVTDMVALPHRAKRLRFESGETLTMHVRSHFEAFRQKGRW